MWITILKELMIWGFGIIVYAFWIIGLAKPKSEEISKKRNQAECDKFNAENDKVNFLYPRR